MKRWMRMQNCQQMMMKLRLMLKHLAPWFWCVCWQPAALCVVALDYSQGSGWDQDAQLLAFHQWSVLNRPASLAWVPATSMASLCWACSRHASIVLILLRRVWLWGMETSYKWANTENHNTSEWYNQTVTQYSCKIFTTSKRLIKVLLQNVMNL